MKKIPMALTAGALMGALLLGGCATDTSTAEPKPSDSVTASATPSAAAAASAAASAVEIAVPAAAGMEVTPVIVDPTMSHLHPEAAAEVQAALKTFLDASRSFPELQKGSRPVRPEDTSILEPVMRPLMTEERWAHSVDFFQDNNPLTLPAWFESGNPFDASYDDDGKPLEESLRGTFTPDEYGMTYVHSPKQPMTIAARVYDDGRWAAEIADVHFRVFYRNVEGGIGALERKITYTFDLQADGSWILANWEKDGGWGSATTQEHIDALTDF